MREDHLFYTTGKRLSSSKDDSKHTFVTQGKTAGKRLREKPVPSVKPVPRCAKIRDRRQSAGSAAPESPTVGTDTPQFPRRMRQEGLLFTGNRER